MIRDLQDYVNSEDLFSKEAKILLAVSGGMDSVVLTQLMHTAGYSIGLAHCNFQLRGADSDGDEIFVQQLALELNVPFYSHHFDTSSYAAEQNISIQMAARDLRYTWLEEIRSTNGYAYIATAHHLNDSLETVIYNFAKGTGIRGLHGILPKQNKIIRPLLFATRDQIAAYQVQQAIAFREDASNASDKYSRNYIRHHIVPALRSLNPNLELTAATTINNLKETEWLFLEMIERYRQKHVRKEAGRWYIDYQKLPKEAAATILFELLSPFGFHGDQVRMILRQEHQAGVYFESEEYVLLIDREELILRPQAERVQRELRISAVDADDALHVSIGSANIECKLLNEPPESFPRDENIALLDFDKLDFPLTLRYWKAGDQFQPFGLNGHHKKVKDFLTNRKLNRFEKNETMVIESNGEICWVVGLRIDERFKVDAGTKRYWQMHNTSA